MALQSINLWGDKIDKVADSINLLRESVPPEGYYATFSGGKDSITALDLLNRSGVKYDSHYNLTTVDPPEIVYFIREFYPEVQIHPPTRSMWRMIEEKGTPPTRKIRYCCEELKERGGTGRIVVTGIRHEESPARNRRRRVETCYKDCSKMYVNPIIDYIEEDVWEYIESRTLRYPILYDQGFKRVGCILCPLASIKAKELEMQRYPVYVANYLRAFEKMLKTRERKGLRKMWSTPEEVFRWYVYGSGDKIADGQIELELEYELGIEGVG